MVVERKANMSTSVWFPFICFVFVQASLPTNSSGVEELGKLLITVDGTLNSTGSSLEKMNTKLMFQKQSNAVLKSTVERISSLVNSKCTLNDCLENWIRYQGSCYKFTQCNGTCTPDNAKVACEYQTASLASVRSEGDNKFVSSLSDDATQRLIIGARDSETENTWLWADGSNVTYTNWAEGEPSDYYGNEDCAIIFPGSKKWNDVNCNGVLAKEDSGYVCEKQITSFCNNQR